MCVSCNKSATACMTVVTGNNVTIQQNKSPKISHFQKNLIQKKNSLNQNHPSKFELFIVSVPIHLNVLFPPDLSFVSFVVHSPLVLYPLYPNSRFESIFVPAVMC